MPKVIVDSDWYLQVAQAASRASAQIQEAIRYADGALQGCDGMAGDDEVGASWGEAYDNAIKPVIRNTCLLSTALASFGARVNQAGHNHDVAEAVAGRASRGVRSTAGQYDAVTHIRLTEPGSAIGPSSEDGGVGASMVGQLIKSTLEVKIPNAHTDRVNSAATILTSLAAKIDAALDAVAHASNNPIDEHADDVRALKSELSANIFAAGEAISSDVRSLSTSARSFAADVDAKRAEMKSEAESAQRDIQMSGGLAIAGALLTAGAAAPGATAAEIAIVAARVALAARRIYSIIKTLEALASVSEMASLAPTVTSSIESKLRASIDHPSADIDIDENGNIKKTPLFPPLKQKAWEEYLRNGGDYDIEKWSKAYDTLMENAATGSAYDKWVAEVMGYTKENGWVPQYVDDEIGGRRWDFANTALRELIENKSGRLDTEQLLVDEIALESGWKVTYNLLSALSPADMARLERLEQAYPGRFTYQWLP